MGWIVTIFVVIALAWAVAICYEFARPGKLNWNQPSWLIPRRRTPPGSGAGPHHPPGGGPHHPPGGAGPQPPGGAGPQPPRDEDHGAPR